MRKLLTLILLFSIICIVAKAEDEKMESNKIENEIFVENQYATTLNGSQYSFNTQLGYKFSYKINKFKIELTPSLNSDPWNIYWLVTSKTSFKF